MNRAIGIELWMWHSSGTFYLYGLILIPALISNYTDQNVWDESIIHSQTLTVQPLEFGKG